VHGSKIWGVLLALAVAVVGGAVNVGAVDRVDLLHASFSVEGMHCDGCSATIVGTLERIDGVVSASADHERGTAEAVYHASRVSAEELAKAISKLGYSVVSVTTEAATGDGRAH
jgi:copper chaperone CopZ